MATLKHKSSHPVVLHGINSDELVISYCMKPLVRFVSQSEPHELVSCKVMRKVLKKGRGKVFLILVRPSSTDESSPFMFTSATTLLVTLVTAEQRQD